MADDLRLIIHTLSTDELKELSQFISRQKQKRSRKDVELLKLLQQKNRYTPKEIIQKLYPEESDNTMAYHALRKRLMRHLSDFILLKQTTHDSSSTAAIMSLISLARYLLERQLYKMGWQYITKAEKLAADAEQYDLLNSIYNLQITYIASEHAPDLDMVLDKRNRNKLLADEDERATIASSLVSKKLNQVRLQGKELNFDEILEQTLQSYQLTQAVSRRPALLYKLITIARSAILVKKDFYSFEPYLISQYQKIESSQGFAQSQLPYKLNLLYMIAHVLYRNRKFTDSIQYLAMLRQQMTSDKKIYEQQLYPKYVLLLAANYVFTHQNAKAVALLEQFLSTSNTSYATRDILNAQLNLAFYYFQQEEYSKANKQLRTITHSDQWCEKKMGKEWVLKKNLSELIIQYEVGNDDLAMNKVRAIERSFVTLFKNPAYKNVQVYVQFIKQLLQNPSSATKEDFFQQVDSSFVFLPSKQEDLQSMGFYAWLKSKMTKRNYYEVLLELANTTD
ncbi:hypothetical protein Q0590_07305 [Rhodocytophaga aerolata]|uniref:Tetratricopeptide repeat protein n=1 Tax=Rhodocytophaga aerolata TaxID=455078 RepID=A0ABT8R323_9BACT|nr:hypothetical protein [Rhodocytophaga aerolata]MDO1446051.1 hypothetical protein [Rhodocytophaga aerolata]